MSKNPGSILHHAWRRWVGHGTMVLLTLHGFGFYGVWLYTAEYTRGLVWDRTGEDSPVDNRHILKSQSRACALTSVRPMTHMMSSEHDSASSQHGSMSVPRGAAALGSVVQWAPA